MATKIEVNHQAVTEALNKLAGRLGRMRPFLLDVGEGLTERTKQRFSSAKAPDGTPWADNSAATLARYIQSRGGVSKKTGNLNAKGRAMAASKKPLQGKSGQLANQIFYDADEDSVTHGSSMIYAAMMHHGGQKSEFPHLWGDIPSRRFMPLTAAGQLDPTEADWIVERLSEYLTE